MSFKVV